MGRSEVSYDGRTPAISLWIHCGHWVNIITKDRLLDPMQAHS